MLDKILTFIIELISKIYIPEPIIIDSNLLIIKHLIKDGDCLVSRKNYELSNVFEKLFFGSFYGHSAIYLGGMVYEASTKGVRMVSLEKFCLTKDAIGICRLPGDDWTTAQILKMMCYCDSLLGEPYDYSFNWGATKKWYCSKLVYFTWAHGNPIGTEAIKINEVLDQPRIKPQDLWNETIQVGSWGDQ